MVHHSGQKVKKTFWEDPSATMAFQAARGIFNAGRLPLQTGTHHVQKTVMLLALSLEARNAKPETIT